MIRPPGRPGVAFTEAPDGDVLGDDSARRRLSRFGVPEEWATVDQIHGELVVEVARSGGAGPADALWTTREDLTVAIFTADCFGVVLHATSAVGVAHAGWRGTSAGIVSALRHDMQRAGHEPVRAATGPGIGPCCFEVGPEVLEEFPDTQSSTSWGTPSVDLRAAIAGDLEGLDLWFSSKCTRHEDELFSHRENETPKRMAAIGWIP